MSKEDTNTSNDSAYVSNDYNEPSTDEPKKMEVYTETLHKTAAKRVRKTLPKPTKYERARIIGVRTTQIANGAEPQTDITGLTDPYEMAVKEFDDGKTPPVIIQRRLPGGEVENVRVSELI